METRQYSDKAGQRTYRDISPRPNPRSGEQRRAKAGDVLKDRTRDRRKEMGRDERGLHREGEVSSYTFREREGGVEQRVRERRWREAERHTSVSVQSMLQQAEFRERETEKKKGDTFPRIAQPRQGRGEWMYLIPEQERWMDREKAREIEQWIKDTEEKQRSARIDVETVRQRAERRYRDMQRYRGEEKWRDRHRDRLGEEHELVQRRDTVSEYNPRKKDRDQDPQGERQRVQDTDRWVKRERQFYSPQTHRIIRAEPAANFSYYEYRNATNRQRQRDTRSEGESSGGRVVVERMMVRQRNSKSEGDIDEDSQVRRSTEKQRGMEKPRDWEREREHGQQRERVSESEMGWTRQMDDRSEKEEWRKRRYEERKIRAEERNMERNPSWVADRENPSLTMEEGGERGRERTDTVEADRDTDRPETTTVRQMWLVPGTIRTRHYTESSWDDNYSGGRHRERWSKAGETKGFKGEDGCNVAGLGEETEEGNGSDAVEGECLEESEQSEELKLNESEGGSDGECQRVASGEDGFVTVSSGAEEDEESFEDCKEFWDSNTRDNVSNEARGGQERARGLEWGEEEKRSAEKDDKTVTVFCLIGQAHTLSVSNKRAYLDLDNLEAMEADQPVSQGEAGQHCHAHENGSAKTPSAEHEEKDTDGHVREEIEHSSEKAISEHNKDFEAALDTRSAAEEGHHGNIVNKETEESPEEGTECQGECEETKREEEGRERHESFEVEDTWTTAEEPKRHSQALHVKWAQNILCDIMGSPEAEGPAHSFKNTEELIEGVVHAGSPAHTRQTGGNIDNGAEPSRQAEVSIFIQAECEEEEVENMGRQGDRETEGSEQSSHTESEMEAEPISPPLGLSDEESVKKGAEKGTKEVKKDGHLLHSTKSFSEVGNSPTFRRKGFRKTLEKNKEEHEEGLGRDRRTRVFHSSEDEDDPLSYTWGEMDLKSSASAIGIIRKRNSKYFNSQLYQQYSEVVQNRELLRQTETLYSYDDSGTTPTPSPAQRPLPPVPSKPYPYTINKSGSFASHTLPLPIPHGRRPPSPRLSISSQSPTLWQHLPGVKNNPEMEEMSEDQRQLQEVRFEVVTSEASYCHSLDIVVEHFVKSKQLGLLLSTQDRKWLFSRLSDVRAISHSFLSKLEERVENDPLQFTVCDIIIHHCPMFRMVYVPYLTNQSYQDKTYQRLMDENSGFKRCVEKLERSSVCQRLPLRSFLVLPFQRITRLKLLVQNIVKRTAPKTEDETQAIKAMKLLEKMIQESNDSITQMKSIESLVSLSAKVDFECKTLPLVSQSRQVVREGPVKEMRDFSMKENERALYIHLFNDYLLLSLYKEGGRFTVIDHAPVSELRAENCRLKLISLQANLFRLHLANKALLLRTDTQSDKLRWISALSRPHPEIDFITAQDIPQMQCIRAYITQQPDELNLEKAEVILAHQQSSDGWVEGTRMSDRQRGWVPESHLELITSEKARQRNLMDSHKITTATAAL